MIQIIIKKVPKDKARFLDDYLNDIGVTRRQLVLLREILDEVKS